MKSPSSMNTRTPLIIAHRGSAGEAPENSMAAFELALRQGCDAIELDIHLSKDGELIVCHDRTIDRTTDGSGAIREMTVTELKQFDAGRWFHEKYAGERIPLLKEVFDLVPQDIMINVEIKETYEGQIEERLLQLLRDSNRLAQVVVSSFDHKSLRRLKHIEPEVKIGLLYTMNAVDHHELANLIGVPVYALHPYGKLIDQEDILRATSHGLQVYPWTINTKDAMQQAIDKGVSGIITDYPGVLKQLLSS
ncbi:glycerophosphodiester phosphodiesterase [Paenibacillus sp. GCM10027629]|uniref:glycerophosphodiester phosphodiesterase n=1 Tax=Paenibacillus sp. GCM10027629 TaxID=3273414 RepID=UPI0036434F1D